MVVGGGLPIIANGAVVGAIGISSGTPAQDREVAQAGVDGFAANSSAPARVQQGLPLMPRPK